MTTTETPVPDALKNLDHAIHRSEVKTLGIPMAQVRAAERAGLLVEFRGEFFGPPEIAETDSHAQLVTSIKAYQRLPGVSELVVGGHTAAELHRLVPVRSAHGHGYPHYYRRYASIEFLGPPGVRKFHRNAAQCTHDVRPSATVTIDDIEVTTLARTLIDLHDRSGSTDSGFVVIGDRLLREELVTMEELEAEVDLLNGREAARARRLLARLDGRAQTESQSRSRILLADLGLPAPELFVDIYGHDGTVLATPPFVWPEHGVIGFCEEVDEYCDFDRRGEEDDRYRWRLQRPYRPDDERRCVERDAVDEPLRDLGFQVFRWTGEQIDRDPCNPCGLRRALSAPLPPRYCDPFDR